ncbi:organic hydroperoxide resistance protein [Martelella soudanensis]|uniref:organic hydroperoxide resistance protein n=1 Tax=unclassified Martelella TaxID=2629616 RepID=UPI0015DE0198|nr:MULTISPECIES: organic hydroperoxide resistance protein [unclassified Martelella]
MKMLYTTRVSATAGREGRVRSDDGILDLALALPEELGGRGGATNPEQLFGACYAACFENSLLRVALQAGHRFADDDVSVVAEVGLVRNEAEVILLRVALVITLCGVDQATGEELARIADTICPYSNAMRGNIDVLRTVIVMRDNFL